MSAAQSPAPSARTPQTAMTEDLPAKPKKKSATRSYVILAVIVGLGLVAWFAY